MGSGKRDQFTQGCFQKAHFGEEKFNNKFGVTKNSKVAHSFCQYVVQHVFSKCHLSELLKLMLLTEQGSLSDSLGLQQNVVYKLHGLHWTEIQKLHIDL